MTTGRDYAPVLDRLIQREVTTMVEVAGMTTFAYDTEELTYVVVTTWTNGKWRRDS